ncbi:MAG TPA: class I SAM-dependent methyltransferase [Polyangiaceae bacterium]|nr:class I SAM-dependent methyltransferase [Polyangiaceae bacterium]
MANVVRDGADGAPRHLDDASRDVGDMDGATARDRARIAARAPGRTPLMPTVTLRVVTAVLLSGALALGVLGGPHAGLSCASVETAARVPDVPYEPSEPEVVSAMLRLADVGPEDVVYDLGCGDGRIVIAAVKERGARGVCVDIDPERIRESRENARRAGVENRITFLEQDLFETDIGDATVVMLFLWPEVNLRLRPKLLRELPAGARVVSHMHDMGDWKPDSVTRVPVNGEAHEVYLWTRP